MLAQSTLQCYHTIIMSNVRIITTEAFNDHRGCMSVPFDRSIAERLSFSICQINQGCSLKAYTLRGLHFQKAPHEQAKVVTCLKGRLFNVAVNLQTGEVSTAELEENDHKLIYIPRGYAHGYLTLEDNTLMQWYVDNDFDKASASAVRFDDEDLNIDWPGDKTKFIISERDRNAPKLKDLGSDDK